MTSGCRALLLALVLLSPFLALHPHVSAEPRDYVREVVCAYPWDCETALSIVRRESGDDSQAVNPSSLCAGWFQVSPIHGFSVEQLLDARLNTRVAYSLYLERGWQPWQ